MFKLKNRIGFYVPSTGENGRIADGRFDDRATKIARLFARFFGGSTVVNCDGYYIDSDDRLIGESIKLVYSFCDSESLERHYDDVIKTAVDRVAVWSQESIGLEINETFILVDSDD